jgi:uncharacterized membrane protein
MEQTLTTVAETAILGIKAAALLFVLVGTIAAFIGGIQVIADGGDPAGHRKGWLRFGHWLLAALAFLLAADIVESSIDPSWNDLGRLAAIVVIRAFLDYSLKRDLEETRGAEQMARET